MIEEKKRVVLACFSCNGTGYARWTGGLRECMDCGGTGEIMEFRLDFEDKAHAGETEGADND